MTTPALFVGMAAPYFIQAQILSFTDLPDPSIVTAAFLEMTRPDGTKVEWTTTIASQDTTQITAKYTLASNGNDLNLPGTWVQWVKLTVPAGTLRTQCTNILVSSANGL